MWSRAVVCLCLTACQKQEANLPLVLQISSEPVTLNPSLAEDGTSIKLLGAVMDGLVGYDSGGKLVPQLAENWEGSADGLRLQVNLRAGQKWSDGTPVQASQFVSRFEEVLAPGSTARLGHFLNPIAGARGYREGKITWDQVGIRAEGEQRLVFRFEQPAPYFLEVLTLPIAYPKRGEWKETGPTTGPYFISQHELGQSYELEANPHYRVPPAVLKARFRVVKDEQTALNLWRQGKIDLLRSVPALEVSKLSKSAEWREAPFWATYYLAFNTRKPEVAHASTRCELISAIDRQALVSVLKTGEVPAHNWVPPHFEGGALKFARESVGKSSRLAGLKFTAGFDAGIRNQNLMEVMQEQLKVRRQVSVQIYSKDWKAYLAELQSDPPALYRMGWLAPFKDPMSHLQVFQSNNPNNYTGWKDAQYDEWVNRIAVLRPGQERLALIHKALKRLMTEACVMVPIYHYTQAHLVSPHVSGFEVTPTGVVRIEKLKKSPSMD